MLFGPKSKDLAGWETWLGVPHPTVTGIDMPKNAKGAYTDAVGLNKDPKQVYSVVTIDGGAAIRVSGEIFGAFTSLEEFENYHLRFEYKWGEKKWAPKDQERRDSGLLYHCIGEHGAHSPSTKLWMQSLECQVQEHDTGDFWSVQNVMVDFTGVAVGKDFAFKKGGQPFTAGARGGNQRILRSIEADKLTGWNSVEVLTLGGTSVHVVNGKVNMVLTNPRYRVGDKDVPLTKGKLQFQSEGAELYYRAIAIRPITAFPAKYRP